MTVHQPSAPDDSPFTAWAASRRKLRPRRFQPHDEGVRFAFYGRISTADHQDHGSSHRWQYTVATDLITGHGYIVTEYFDAGVSRRTAWPDRPHAARLLADLPVAGRSFDAVVVGEYERAFQGQQLEQLTPILRRHHIALWLPETYGPVDFNSPRQIALLDLLGVRSQREVHKARFRVIAAMRAQTELQGRHLGGRPPYGYMIVDAGPHPNRADARWGRRLHRLEPAPATADHVRWIFAQRLTGRSIASITRDLNDKHVPCPSGADPARNRHRAGSGWLLTTVAAILANPRYTGRQVWNRQYTDHDDLPPLDGLARHSDTERWSLATQWAISAEPAHPALVTEADFVAVQQIHTAPLPADGAARSYALTRLVVCGVCGRALDAHWTHGRPGYRCRHGHNSSQPTGSSKPRILYTREDHLIELLQANATLLCQHPQLRHATAPAVADILKHSNMIMVGDHHGWTVESDHTTVALTATAWPAVLQMKIPAHRAGNQS